MKVVQLGPYPPPHGGVQTNLVAIREFLLRRGIACPVINLTRFRSQTREDVYYPANALEVVSLLVRLRGDIIHIHLGGGLTPRLIGLCLACSLVPGAKTVLTFHSGGYPSSAEGRTARRTSVRGLVFRRLDAIIAVNQEIAGLFRKFGVPSERIHLILPHAPALLDRDVALPELLAEFLRTHDPVLSTVGLLEPEYDLQLQIEALGQVRTSHRSAGLAIIGAGSLEAELRRLIATQPWSEHIALCGDVPRAATLRVIAESRLLLRTTRYDGDSVAVREALALGTPVIAADNGMRPGGVCLIPAGDREALCQAILQLLAEEKRPAVPQGEGGEQNIEAVYEIYRDLTGGRP